MPPGEPEKDTELMDALKTLAAATVALTTATATVSRLLEERAEQGKWLPVSVAAERIGGISPNWILSRIRDGRYKHGVHFVDTSDGSRPSYLVSVAAIRKEMSKAPEKRNTCHLMVRGVGKKRGEE